MDKTLEFLKTLAIPLDSYIILGCSGGKDSMCLLDLLCKNGYKVVVAHVDHNIRKESPADLKFVASEAAKRNMPFESIRLEKGTFDEAYYRKKRYDFYKELCSKYKTEYIATAHHGDDLIETVLMRLVRGSNLKGYMGFSKVYSENGLTYIKPLIFYTKKEIEEYDELNGIPSVHDSTNDLDSYTRNRYRHQILPFFKNETPKVHAKFLKFSEELEETTNFIDKLVQDASIKAYKDGRIDVQKFLELDSFLQKKLLERVLKDKYGDSIVKIKEIHIQNILKNISSGKNFSIDLPEGYTITKEYGNINIFKKENSQKAPYKILLEEHTVLPTGGVIRYAANDEDTSNYTIRLNSKDLNLPLYIRTRREGDVMAVKNLAGTKKVKTIFIDEKIDKRLRDDWPILVDATDTILWIPGLKKSKFDISFKEKYDIILRYEKGRKF